jgi:hypothetical protein
MTKTEKTMTRPILSPAFGNRAHQPAVPAPAATLSSHELKRIVAAMLG